MLPNCTRTHVLGAALLSLFLGAGVREASAQVAAGRGPLDIPAGLPLECKVPPPTARERDATPPPPNPMLRRRFSIPRDDGGPDIPGLPPFPQREIDVGWDSTGKMRMLLDRAQLQRGKSAVVLAMIMPNGAVQGNHMLVTVDSASVVENARSGVVMDPKEMMASNPPVQREFTPADLVRIKELGAWLWTRRCNATR